jgi:hypothetical protein
MHICIYMHKCSMDMIMHAPPPPKPVIGCQSSNALRISPTAGVFQLSTFNWKSHLLFLSTHLWYLTVQDLASPFQTRIIIDISSSSNLMPETRRVTRDTQTRRQS